MSQWVSTFGSWRRNAFCDIIIGLWLETLLPCSLITGVLLSCSGVGFQPTPNRRDWTGWRNSTKFFWTFTRGTERQRPKQKVSSQTRWAVGTWERAFCNITKPNIQMCSSDCLSPWKHPGNSFYMAPRLLVSELQEMSLDSVSLLNPHSQILHTEPGKTWCISCWFILGYIYIDTLINIKGEGNF